MSSNKHNISKIAIIPARGGSKRIPKKNIIDFFGRPMIAYTIESVLKSNIFDYVMVSTDDEEIAQIARKYGAEVPFLRDDNFDDHSTVSDVVHGALNMLRAHCNLSFDQVAMIMANCPLKTSNDLIQAYENFNEGGAKFQISCVDYGWLNPWWAHKIGPNGKGQKLFNDTFKRSQDLEKLYCPTGVIWLANVKEFLIQKTFYGSDYRFFPLPWKSSVDIDNYDDLDMAEVLFKMRENNISD